MLQLELPFTKELEMSKIKVDIRDRVRAGVPTVARSRVRCNNVKFNLGKVDDGQGQP